MVPRNPKAIQLRMNMGKRVRFKAKADLLETFSLPAAMSVKFFRFHKGKPYKKSHSPLFQMHASHDLLQLLPSGGMDRWSRLN